MENKTICFFNSTKEWGGGEKWHFDMASQMYNDNKNVIVVTNKNSVLFDKLKQKDIKILAIKISNFSFLNPLKILKLYNFFKKNKINFIIINLSADLKIAGIASKLAKIPNIIYRRGSAIPVKKTWFNKFLFKKIITNIIANTEATKKTINQNYNFFPKNKIDVIYNGINLDEFDEKQNFEFKNEKLIIGNLGRLVKQKAQFYLIELAKILKNRNLNFQIIIGGKGKLENELKQLSKSLGVENEIIFEGFVENPRKFMSKIDVFVLTSLWEGFGYVLVEAMANYKPTIAFDISSNPEIIENEKTGFLIKFADVQQIADKIEFFIKNKQLISEFGSQGRKCVENKFTIQKSYNKLCDFLDL